MKSKLQPKLIQLACLGLVLSSCEKAGTDDYVDLSELPGFLKSFAEASEDRSESHHSTTVMMEDFSFQIGTQEATKTEGEDWEYIFGGPSRESGFFVVPRMEWAETIEEVEAIIRADQKTGKGIPTSAFFP